MENGEWRMGNGKWEMGMIASKDERTSRISSRLSDDVAD